MEKNKNYYICSDIHGMYGSYSKVVNRLLKKDDELFILGDVIDRGKYGIKILMDIMKRSNVHLLIGNHEYMMMQCIDILNKNGISTFAEANALINCCNIISRFNYLKIDIENAEKKGDSNSSMELRTKISEMQKMLDQNTQIRQYFSYFIARYRNFAKLDCA